MADPVGALRVDLSAGHAQFKADMGKARGHVQREGRAMSSAMAKVKTSFSNTIKSIGAMAAAYVGLYAAIREMKAIVTQAANYETALVNMAKVTGQSFEEIDKIIKGIGPEIGNYTELMKGYYQTISAGVTEPVKALEMLKAASKLAKIAGIEQGETVKALTKVMMGYGGEIETATDASDLLLAMEMKGQTQVSELVPVIGKLATVSKMSGLAAEDMGGALAVLTQTTGSVAEATDMLSAALTTLIKPTPAMTKEFEEFGGAINFIKEAGFEEWLKRIQRASGGTQEALTKMLGGKKNASLAIASLLDTLNEDITEMKNRTGKAATAWENYEKTSNAALDKFKNNIHNLEIILGTALLPALNDVAGKTSEWVKQNEKLIGQKFDEYVKAAVAHIKDLIKIHSSMPPGSVDAGIVGLILAGKYGPLKLVFALMAINDAMHNIGNSFGDMRSKSNLLTGNLKTIWDVLTGKRDWNTGEWKEGLKEVAKEAENTGRVVIDISKAIAAQYAKAGAGDGGGVKDPVVNPNEAAIIKQIEALKLQRDTFGMATKEIVLYNLALLKATLDQLKLAEAILETTEKMKAYAATDDAIIKMMADINEGVKLSKEGLKDLADTTEENSSVMDQAFAGWGNSFSSTLNDMLWGSEVTFESIAESFAKMVTQMMIQKHLVEGMFGGGSSSGSGWFGIALKAISGASGASAGGSFAYQGPGQRFAKGNAFQGGNLLPFAQGGVVSLPTVFPMAQGAGLMGEAGPEAVMPLKRTSSGDLGVVSSGEGGGTTIIINAIDSKSFAEVVKRNPGSIVTVINDALQNRTGLLDTIRGTI